MKENSSIAKFLDSQCDKGGPDGTPVQVTFKNGVTVPGAIRRAEGFPGLYQLRTVQKDPSGGGKQAQGIDVWFEADSVFFIGTIIDEKIVRPQILAPSSH